MVEKTLPTLKLSTLALLAAVAAYAAAPIGTAVAAPVAAPYTSANWTGAAGDGNYYSANNWSEASKSWAPDDSDPGTTYTVPSTAGGKYVPGTITWGDPNNTPVSTIVTISNNSLTNVTLGTNVPYPIYKMQIGKNTNFTVLNGASFVWNRSVTSVSGVNSTLNIQGSFTSPSSGLAIGGTNADGTMNVTAGNVHAGNLSLATAAVVFTATSHSTLNLSGTGIVTIDNTGAGSGLAAVGQGAPNADHTSGLGIVNQTGGTFNATSLIVGNYADGVYNLSAGALNVTSNLGIDSNPGYGPLDKPNFNVNAQGVMNITGGTVAGQSLTVGNNGPSVDPTPRGTGLLHVTGSAATIGFSGGTISILSNGTLQDTIDGTGISLITATGYVTLSGALVLDGTPTAGTTYDLIATTNTTGGKDFDGSTATFKGFNLSGLNYDSANWTLGVVNEGGRNILQATMAAAVPEPASLGLLALAGAGLLLRRKGR